MSDQGNRANERSQSNTSPSNHLPDAVIGEPYHLPECSAHYEFGTILNDCICDMLRACEQRVKHVERPLSYLRGATYGRDCGWDEALDAAEAAVEAIPAPYKVEGDHLTYDSYHEGKADMQDLAVAAIRALKETP